MSDTLQSLGITAESITEYNKRIPRYTSYPTAPYWNESVNPDAWREHLERHAENPNPLSLYVHVPFCAKRCLFCGCNVIITPKFEVCEEYIGLLEREIEILKSVYPAGSRVIQLHFGGGTPNYLPRKEMDRLFAVLEAHFDFDPAGERSIEADPRISDPDYIRYLHDEHGFKRISFGVQDFHEPTQVAIGRGQTHDCTFTNTAEARRIGFEGVNIDLIYGLPHQDATSWSTTLDTVAQLRPDRIALYNFAYLPKKMPNQRPLDPDLLPPPTVKLQMFIEAHNRLTAEGWRFIGMDHYALETDSLSKAQEAGTLRRNFMGYTTLRGTDLLGFGVSSISDFQGAFAQNVKKLSQYRALLDAGKLPVEHGLMLSDDDRFRQYVIEEIMCNGILKFETNAVADGEKFRELVEGEADRLKPLEDDGLIQRAPDALRVTSKGRIFLRNIAVVFDAYFEQLAQKTRFSKAV